MWLASLTDAEIAALPYEWRFWARPNQLPPDDDDWFIWLAKPGRGWGKTRAGAEAVRLWVESGKAKRIALVNDTARDTRDIMVEGQDGIIAKSPPWCKPKYEPSKSRVVWPDGGPWAGAIAHLYAAEAPELLRGPQHDLAWCDELAKWQNLRKTDAEGGTAFDNLLLGMRIGTPRVLVTTTPRAVPLIRQLVKNPRVRIVDGSTYENRANLSDVFFQEVIAPIEKTRLGRQEVYGQLLEDVEGALWTRKMIEGALAPRVQPPMKRVVVAIDPAVTATEQSDETGLIVAGVGIDNHGYILADESGRYTPEQWARKAVQLYGEFQADRIVAEVNNGGDLVGYTLRTMDRHVSYKELHASRGKRTRAEPVASLYEQERVHHVKGFAEMEDQLCVAGGTLVQTRYGPERVELVSVGDEVLTRVGWRRVLWSGLTGRATCLEIRTAAGRSLRCTASHPVWVEDRGFCSAKEVQLGDRCLSLSPESLSSTAALSTSELGSLVAKSIGDQPECERTVVSRCCCIACSGQKLTATSQTTARSTIGMVTVSTMSSPTSNALLDRVTSSPTVGAAHGLCRQNSEALTVNQSGNRVSRIKSSASDAGQGFPAQDSAPCFVADVVVAVTTTATGPEPVYNLTVEGQPEYFASGLLTHNCTWDANGSEKSPDRLDALVWALTELMLERTQAVATIQADTSWQRRHW